MRPLASRMRCCSSFDFAHTGCTVFLDDDDLLVTSEGRSRRLASNPHAGQCSSPVLEKFTWVPQEGQKGKR